MTVVNIDGVMDAVAEQWSPRIVATVNDYDVKVANVSGEFPAHIHDRTDEFFLVLSGRFDVELPDEGRTVSLGPLDVFTVPRGVLHRPTAAPGTRVLVFEPRGTSNTGDSSGTTGVPLDA